MTETILAVDAGYSTGWVLAEVSEDPEIEIEDLTVLAFGQDKHDTYFDTVEDLANRALHGNVSTLVIERFDLRPGNKFLADLTTVRVNAALEYVLRDTVRVVEQTPAQAKMLVSNTGLKNLGWYPTGKTVGQPDADDVRDAFRHLAYYGVKTLKLRDLTRRLAGV